MVKKVGIGLGVLLVIFVGVGFMLPGEYSASRSIEIQAPANYLYSFLIVPKNHETFSPWKANDDTLKMTYNDIESGVGASYSWTSDNSGAGTNTLATLVENRSIRSTLVFEGMGESEGWWTLEPKGDSTVVTWGFDGKASGLMDRYMGSMMDSFVGPSFEQGLGLLKAHVEPAYAKQKEAEEQAVADNADVPADADEGTPTE